MKATKRGAPGGLTSELRNQDNAMIQTLGLIAAIILPLWNIPLIVRIVKRKSSEDISLSWAAGVWTCLALMAPSGFQSEDRVWKVFNMVNIVLFSAVLITVFIFRKKPQSQRRNGRDF